MTDMARPALVIACALYLAGVVGDNGPVAYVTDTAKQAAMPAAAVDSGMSDAVLTRSLRAPGKAAPALVAITAVDYPLARYVPAAATNYSVASRPRDYPVDMIVIHDIEGSTASAITAFQDPARHGSAHYV